MHNECSNDFSSLHCRPFWKTIHLWEYIFNIYQMSLCTNVCLFCALLIFNSSLMSLLTVAQDQYEFWTHTVQTEGLDACLVGGKLMF